MSKYQIVNIYILEHKHIFSKIAFSYTFEKNKILPSRRRILVTTHKD